jgi:thiamine monophosphate kinase
VVIHPDWVPLHATAEVVDEALVSGEEYELLLALPAGAGAPLVEPFRAAFNLPLTQVGVVEEGGGVQLRRRGGPVRLPTPFTHFP